MMMSDPWGELVRAHHEHLHREAARQRRAAKVGRPFLGVAPAPDGTASPPTPEVLDTVAHVVATALGEGDDCRAWALTRTLEQMSGAGAGTRPGAAAEVEQPPGPVIGRRFARAHRLLLSQDGGAG